MENEKKIERCDAPQILNSQKKDLFGKHKFFVLRNSTLLDDRGGLNKLFYLSIVVKEFHHQKIPPN